MTSSQPTSEKLVVSYGEQCWKAPDDRTYLYCPLYVGEDAYRSGIIWILGYTSVKYGRSVILLNRMYVFPL